MPAETYDLRAAIIPGLERLAQDVTIGRHGDPFVAVTVLVHADREPTVLVIHDGRPAFDLTRTVAGEKDEKGARFPLPEILESGHAVTDAHSALRWWRSRDGKPGDVVRDKIRSYWENRRRHVIEQELSRAAEESARPEKCPHCKSRFTTRGIKMHLARARYCSQQEAKA